MLSKVQLEALPLPAHDSAAGAAAAHRCDSWLDGDDGTADDLSNTVTADATDTFGAGKSIFQEPWPPARCAVDLQYFRFAAERGRLRVLVGVRMVLQWTSVLVRGRRRGQTGSRDMEILAGARALY